MQTVGNSFGPRDGLRLWDGESSSYRQILADNVFAGCKIRRLIFGAWLYLILQQLLLLGLPPTLWVECKRELLVTK